MPNIIMKGHTKPLYIMIIAKTSKQKLNNQLIIISLQRLKHHVEDRRQTTIEGRQQSIEMRVIW